MSRHFNDSEAKNIRDFLTRIDHGIDMLSDSELCELQGIVGTHNKNTSEFRQLLARERRKSRAIIGPEPYLNYRKRKRKMETQKTLDSNEQSASGGDSSSNHVSVELCDLQIDRAYQRHDYINKRVVKSIQNNFDDLLVGVITVGRREDGSLWVVDGQHRVLGARQAGKTNLKCVVFSSRGADHEAEVFYELNTQRTSINCISMYRALLTQKEEATVCIQQLLDKYGFAIGKKTGEFAAANTIRSVYKLGVLDRVLHTIKESFGSGSDRWKWMFGSSHFVQMLALVYSKTGKEIEDDRMSLVLARMQHLEYQRLASTFAGTTGNRAVRIAPEFIELVYNKGLKKNRIEWSK